jgi:NaMN:DMB phosphoribosyltransferase
VAGITAGSEVPVILAGGTQMTAVCAVLKELFPDFNWNMLSIATQYSWLRMTHLI